MPFLTKKKVEKAKEKVVDTGAAEIGLLGELEDLATQIASTSDKIRGLGDTASEHTKALGVTAGVTGVISGGREFLGGAFDAGAGVKNVYHGYHEHDWGDGSGPHADSISKNLGAQQIEGGVQDMITGGTGLTGGVGNIVQGAASEIPGLDSAVNFTQAAVKGKKGIEDSVASGRLGNQKVRIKREGDRYLPEAVRAARFGEFAAAVGGTGKTKAADVKRWPAFYAKWQAHAAGLDPSLNLDVTSDHLGKAAPTTTTTTSGGTGTTGTTTATAPPPAPTTWHPIRSLWPAGGAGLTPAQQAFLKFLGTADANGDLVKEFGFGTAHRQKHEGAMRTAGKRGSTQAEAGPGTTPEEQAADDYERMRDLGKFASFGQRRKGETATVNMVEAAGHTADAVGSFTAAGDMGATKITGKVIKGTSAAYKSVKGLVKRGRRVKKLMDAKNTAGYGNKTTRGAGWAVKTFFGGNVSESMDKARTSVQDKVGGTTTAGNHKQSHAALDANSAAPLLKKLTLQLDRKIDDLMTCLMSKNDVVHNRAKKLLHIVAETNLAGGIQKIDDGDLDRLRAERTKHDADPQNYPVASKKVLDRQEAAIREIISRQLKGIGG